MKLATLSWMALVLAGCATAPRDVTGPVMPESDVLDLCEAGRYHRAMQALPEFMQAWAAYTERTGNTAEGAAGYVYSEAMYRIATQGDADWGTILDDPSIPYEYKTSLIFEILEARLGKGAVYAANDELLIVPRRRPADLTTEMIHLPVE